jgi:hypothetical protein
MQSYIYIYIYSKSRFGHVILHAKSEFLNKIVENVLCGSAFEKLRFENLKKIK